MPVQTLGMCKAQLTRQLYVEFVKMGYLNDALSFSFIFFRSRTGLVFNSELSYRLLVSSHHSLV